MTKTREYASVHSKRAREIQIFEKARILMFCFSIPVRPYKVTSWQQFSSHNTYNASVSTVDRIIALA